MDVDKLPDLVLDKLVDFLDYKTRKKCRLVSRRLKRHVDDIGLSLKIDSRKSEVLELCRSVTAEEAQILHLKDVPFPDLEGMKTAIVSGPLGTGPGPNVPLRTWPNLTVLILNGHALIDQDFSSLSAGPKPLPTFQHLAQVHISLSSKVFMEGVNSFVNSLRIDFSLNACKTVDQLVQRNMAYFMRSLRSRSLKLFYAAVFVNLMEIDAERPVRWELDPLYEFIDYHRSSLETVMVPGLFSGQQKLEHKAYNLPTQLKHLYYHTAFSPEFLSFWKDVILAQRALQELILNQPQAPNSEVCSLLSPLIANNFETLTYLSFSLNQSTDSVQFLDMTMFRPLESLRFFAIHGDDQPNLNGGSVVFPEPLTTILNLNQLQRARLTTLKLLGVRIGKEFDGVGFMSSFRPAHLVLHNLDRDGVFKDPAYILRFAAKILQSRALEMFYVSMHPNTVILDVSSSVMSLDSSGFDLWVANLKAMSPARPANHRWHSLSSSDFRDLPPRARAAYQEPRDQKGRAYVERERAVNLSFMEIWGRAEFAEVREQPFNVPLGAESYTFWINEKTKAYKVLPNAESYSGRVKDIGRIEFSVDLLLLGDNITDLEPVGMKMVGLSD